MHHPLKMRVPIEAPDDIILGDVAAAGHHPLKMRVPIEAADLDADTVSCVVASPSENEGPY